MEGGPKRPGVPTRSRDGRIRLEAERARPPGSSRQRSPPRLNILASGGTQADKPTGRRLLRTSMGGASPTMQGASEYPGRASEPISGPCHLRPGRGLARSNRLMSTIDAWWKPIEVLIRHRRHHRPHRSGEHLDGRGHRNATNYRARTLLGRPDGSVNIPSQRDRSPGTVKSPLAQSESTVSSTQGQPAPALLHDRRCECPFPVPGHVQFHREYRLGPDPVSGFGGPLGHDIALRSRGARSIFQRGRSR